MIYTLTFNPSIDYICTVNDFKVGYTNRTDTETMLPGGKGINVSIVLNNLGCETTALGFIAGFTGAEIERGLIESGINVDFIKLQSGHSRINVKLISTDGTEINGNGVDVTKEALSELFSKLDNIEDGDVLVLGGSIPKSLSVNIYSEILTRLQNKNILTCVDATKDLLINTLQNKPFLIKPNKHELEEIFEKALNTTDEIICYGKKLQEKGARNVLISLGGDGAILITENNEIFQEKVKQGKLINSVGAGDSMVAGFLYGYLETKDYHHALKMGLSSGSASAYSEYLATKEEVFDIFAQY